MTTSTYEPSSDHSGWRALALPAVPVDDLVEGPTVGPGERPERPVGRVAQADQVDGEIRSRWSRAIGSSAY